MRGRPIATLLLLLTLAPRLAAQEVFQVNTYTQDRQGDPAVSADTGGGFVVVWQSSGQDGDYFGVFGQRYAAGGARVGTEFQVNEYTFGAQESPAVATLAGGGFVVVWDGYGAGGDSSEIFARRFDAGGVPASSEFQVNEPAFAYEAAAAVAATADGGFVVVWDDYNDVLARRFDAAGVARGGAVRVEASDIGMQNGAAVAALPTGGFVVAWGDGYYPSDGQDGSGYGVFGRRFDSAGAALGSEFQINAATLGDQYGPAIAAQPGGGFVVVWLSYGAADAALVARRYDSAGTAVGTEVQVSPPSPDVPGLPSIAASAAGGFVVTWASAPPSSSATSVVLVRHFDSLGAPLGGAEVVQPAAVADQFEPVVGVVTDAGAVVVWRGAEADGSDGAVLARIVSGTPGTPRPTPEPSPTAPASPTAVATSTAAATSTAVSTATASPSPQPSAESTPTLTPTRAASPTATAPPPAPTQTPSLTASAPPTSTASPVPSETSTAPATRTPSVAACAGDCNANGVVSVDDLILGVNVALGIQPLARCAAADRDGDGQVGVAELILAVNRALGGCA